MPLHPLLLLQRITLAELLVANGEETDAAKVYTELNDALGHLFPPDSLLSKSVAEGREKFQSPC